MGGGGENRGMWLIPANGFQNHSRLQKRQDLALFMGPDPIKGDATCAGGRK